MALMYVDGHFVGLEERGKLMLIKADPERYERVAEIQPHAAARGRPGQRPAAPSVAVSLLGRTHPVPRLAVRAQAEIG